MIADAPAAVSSTPKGCQSEVDSRRRKPGALPKLPPESGSTYAHVTGLPLVIERCELRPLVRDTSGGFTKVSIVVRLTGGSHVGEGEDITWDQIDQIEFLRAGGDLAWLHGTRTFDEFSRLLGLANLFAVAPIRDSARQYRRWAFESAALDLALRQNGLSLQAAVGRPARPVTFVASVRIGDPPSLLPLQRAAGRGSRAPLQAGPDERLGRRPRGRARAPRLRRRHRPEGPLPQRRGGDGRRARPVPPRDRGVPRSVDRRPRPRSRDRGPARVPPRPDHLGRADSLDRRHRGPAVATADAQPQARPLRQCAGAVRHLRLLRGARHRRLRRRDVRAGPGARTAPVSGLAVPSGHAERHRPRGLQPRDAPARSAALAAGARAAPDRFPLGDVRRPPQHP